MKQITSRILLILFLVSVMTLGFKCGKDENAPPANSPCGVPMPLSFSTNVISPSGVWVIADVPVPQEALDDIDTGITNQLIRTRLAEPSWTEKNNFSDYHLMFVEPMATNQETEPGSPALIVKGYQTAGTVVGVGNDGCNMDFIVLPHQRDSNWKYRDYLMHSAWHESEHDREWPNNKNIFFSFANAGDVHPHYRLPGE